MAKQQKLLPKKDLEIRSNSKRDPKTVFEINNTYNHVEQFINLMDERCILELCSGYVNDIDKIFDVIQEETMSIVNLRSDRVNTSELNYLPSLKTGYEEYLRKMSLPYFVSSCIPDYQMAYHCIEWMQMIMLYPKLCILASRDHSKSFTLSFASIIWDMYRYEKRTELIEPPKDIINCRESMLITNEFKLAKKLLKKIKSEIESNDILHEKLYPGRFAEGWSKESLTCKNGAELTLSSFHSSNRGPHPGRITVDDFLDRSALYSKDARDRFLEAFMAEVMNMIIPSGRVRVIGTPFHLEDLYHVLKKDDDWQAFEYPALFPDGSVLWPDRYDFDALMGKRKTFGNLIFSREFLVRPISDTISIFPYSILEVAFIGMDKMRLVNNRQSYSTKFKKVVIGCDFALSATAAADYSVFAVMGIDHTDCIHLLHITRLHGASHNEQILRIQRLNSDFNPNIIVFETNGFQKIMLDLAKEAGMRNVMPFNTTGFKKKDAYSGVPSLAVMFERGEIKFPRGDEYSIETTNYICSEFNSMVFDEDSGKLEAASGKDDAVMAIFFAVLGMKTVNTGFRISILDTSVMMN